MTRFHRTTHLLKGDAWDLAPFLCVLFPLTFFLLFTHTLVRPTGSILVLPPAGTNAPTLPPGRQLLVVALDRDGRLYFENQQLDAKQLGAALTARVAMLPAVTARELVLVLEADAGVSHASVERVGRLARQAGIRDVVVTAQP